ncbi:unnamed protein product [Hermetia illucens]|uniref:Guanylate cyclase n=1 Tax=Hermetia illucens TaxID=343691 RepID=A0A7R8V576_HERIL|nr:atrial natriuretic peptide receptor 1 isoform X2 [Hermetia illucens]XP_037922690.1 atrial natriuretic peptide receptor 1 isoform X2 [Hermetia illucens]CAD7092893.1 unnamed protein product [Hermetia illucens]
MSGASLVLNLLLSCFLVTVIGESTRMYKSRATEIVLHFGYNSSEVVTVYTGRGDTNASRHLENMIESSPRRNLVFAVLLPSESQEELMSDCIYQKVLPVLELALRKIQHPDYLSNEFDITLVFRDTFCSSVYGPIGLFEIYNERKLNAIFGLCCEYVLAPVARYAGVWEIPILTTAGRTSAFDAKASYSTLLRMIGGPTQIGYAVKDILNFFNWTTNAMIFQNNEGRQHAGNSICYFTLGSMNYLLKSVINEGFEGDAKKPNITRTLNNIKSKARIIIMCASPKSIRQIMLVAEELKMIDSGEYVFINIELFSKISQTETQPWYDEHDTETNNKRAKKAYTALLTITGKQPVDKEYLEFSEEVKSMAASKYNYTFEEGEPVSTFVTAFHDAVLLYAYALNDSITNDPSVLTKPFNGTDIFQRMLNRRFRGITGNVTIDSNGDRISAYSLLDMNPVTGRFEIVADYFFKKLEYAKGKSIHWAGDRTEAPPDKPVCGFDGSLCPDNSLPGYAILSLVLGFTVIIMAIISFLGYRHYKSEAEINSMTWKINWNDVIPCDPMGKYRGSVHSLAKRGSQVTLCSEDIGSLPGDRQLFIPVAFYKGCKVAIKKIEESNINLNRTLMLELKRMKDIQHDHLVKFYGACLDPPKCCILTEYCPKGSLQDILENEQINLDWMFKLSLMHDIVRGMHFLHQSDLKSHGNLKSSNCVVDSRFVLKITDFGLHQLRKPNVEDDVENCNSFAYWKRLLWTAPELLRIDNPPIEGTQKGDVYSFGIIVNEIITRQGPFYLGSNEKSPQEIIEAVKNYPSKGMPQPFRPRTDEIEFSDIHNMMVKCWAEDPSDRPDFGYLKTTIRKINKDNETGNIVDNLLQRMEMYANNLEGLVEERTRDYLEEKKKCEKLLYQLLPQSVAAQLISGMPVIAETYDQVTIYFSDIVGFTALSAESTPMQVVSFLNDLYTCFDSIVENYDVYKVETIGDAYMVVSGLPVRNGNLHAREIARLALALLDAVSKFTIRHRPNHQLRLRIGLHSGPCVAGVVGLKMPRYCLFGDTVNTASRMESNGEPLKIHISQNTKEILDTFKTFIIKKRGFVKMKGKGEMLTYWLEGEHEPQSNSHSSTHSRSNFKLGDPMSRPNSDSSLNVNCSSTSSKNIVVDQQRQNDFHQENHKTEEQLRADSSTEGDNSRYSVIYHKPDIDQDDVAITGNGNPPNIMIPNNNSSSLSLCSSGSNCTQNQHHHPNHRGIHHQQSLPQQIPQQPPQHQNLVRQSSLSNNSSNSSNVINTNSNSTSFNNIVKTNNLKNLKSAKCCNNVNSSDDNVKGVTTPLLARINS